MKSIFIIGCARSGTTLTGRLLGACKDVSYWEESYIFQKLNDNEFETQDQIDLFLKYVSIVSSLKSKDYPDPQFNLFHSFLSAGLNINKSLSYLRELRGRNFLENVIKHEVKENWVEKTPIHTHFIDQIRAFIPEVTILHVCRNPLDTLASFKDYHLKFGHVWDIENSCRTWNEFFAIASMKSDFSIRYRDLTYNKLIAKQLVEQLNLEWTEDCDSLYDGVSRNSVGCWDKRLTKKEIWTAYKLIDWELAERGGFYPY